jgi:arsenate reductase (glutaredoxin)
VERIKGLMMKITLYGIANCDTVKRARAWLLQQGQVVQFHDFKRHGVPETALDAWIEQCGWQPLINCQGTTWRKLDEALRHTITSGPSAKSLMLVHPSCIKRPVVLWPDHQLTLGFDENDWVTRL